MMNCQVCSEEMNASEPLMRCRNGVRYCQNQTRKRKFGISLDVNWHNRQREGGIRHRRGMNSRQALIRNTRTCRSDVKGEAQVETPQGESTDAEHRDGLARSSDEVSVMEMERRG